MRFRFELNGEADIHREQQLFRHPEDLMHKRLSDDFRLARQHLLMTDASRFCATIVSSVKQRKATYRAPVNPSSAITFQHLSENETGCSEVPSSDDSMRIFAAPG
jgi:hypothetical protein